MCYLSQKYISYSSYLLFTFETDIYTRQTLMLKSKKKMNYVSLHLQGYIGLKGPRGDFGEPGEKVITATIQLLKILSNNRQ